MPAKNLNKAKSIGSYHHVYNKGIANKLIFKDQEDYQVFVSYLNDYLTTPSNPEINKKIFTVKGRSYRGLPHQPKNYESSIKLLSYSLSPNRFHLVLQQISSDPVGKFIRSLCTRYSMYFNKKYNRSGPLFDGPYKSVVVADKEQLTYLSRYLHRLSNGDKYDSNWPNSSYPEFVGQRNTSWVDTQTVLSYFDQSKARISPNAINYKDFVENQEVNQKEESLLSGIIPTGNSWQYKTTKPKIKTTAPVYVNPIVYTPNPQSVSMTSELIVISIVFFVLLTLGIRNVAMAANYKPLEITTSPTPETAQLTPPVEKPTSRPVVPEQDSTPKTVLIVRTAGGTQKVNIRKEPSTGANIIAKAKDGDFFESSSHTPDWYQITLKDDVLGYISSQFVEETSY